MYIWPQTLVVPPKPPKLVYLDLNHWVSLAKAVSDHREAHLYKDILSACEAARDAGDAIFPISSSTYFEVSKMVDRRRRRTLRDAIERLSGFVVVTARNVISGHEIEAMLDERFGPRAEPIYSTHYIDWGVARAFGMVGGFRIRDGAGNDVTDDVRRAFPAGPDAFDRYLAQAELDLNRSVLDGPVTDEDEADLRAGGYNPSGGYAPAERRAQQEIDQIARFDSDPRWRIGRIRDVISAREIMIEIGGQLREGLSNRGVDDPFDVVFPDTDEARQAFDSMPSFDVAVSLKVEYHRDPNHRWTPNDIIDIDALGATLPYCDIAVTDKAIASQVTRSGIAERLNVHVLTRLSDLPRLL